MKSLWCRRCGTRLIEGVPPGDDRVRHHCSACGHVEYRNPRVRAGCISPLPGGGAALRTLMLHSGERLQTGVIRALGVPMAEDDLVLYCAITDPHAGEVCLVFRSAVQIAPPGHAVAGEPVPEWEPALMSRFARDAEAGRFPVYTAKSDGAALEFARVDPDR